MAASTWSSGARSRRRWREGVLRAVVATSSLDLGIDWGDVDLVVQVGAPKGAARLLQRIGRANHRLDEPSRAVMIPGNRFEVLECMAAEDALAQHTLDGGLIFPGGLDVLAQHITGVACAGPFEAGELYEEVRSAAPFAALTRKEFDDTVEFVATGGYALRTYERYRRLEEGEDGRWRLADPQLLRRYRMNIGTIVEAPLIRIRLGRKRLGEVEEMFIASLAPGDTFLFAGQLLRFESIRDGEAIVTLAKDRGDPKVPTYAGARLPLSTHLADRVRALIADRERWAGLPEAVREWLQAQERRAAVPAADELLVETFARAGRHYLVAYCFAGRNAQQTLGHAAHPADGAAWPEAAGLLGHRLLPCRLEPAPGRGCSRSVQCRHPGRRARGVDGGELAGAPDVQELCRRRRADRAPHPGPGEDGAAGHLQLGPDLRRAAQV